MNFISIKDFSKKDFVNVYSTVGKYTTRKTSTELKDKFIALIFEKPSTRTRVSFEVGINQLGGKVLVLTTQELQLSRGEAIKDTIGVLNRYIDGVILRVNSHETILEFAKCSTIPIINALSDKEHPCQVLSDIYTILEIKKVSLDELKKIKFVYIGDANNVCYSLMYATQILGMNSYFIIPKEIQPKNIKDVFITDEISYVKNADVVYTDVWVSMGQEKEKEKRLKMFKKYQVNKKLLSLAKDDCIIMHCLPAQRGVEITDEVIDSKNSVVIKQAENRLYVQKALLVYIYSH